jgi:hypothetical protein
MRNGKRATSLFLAEGRVIISGNLVPEVWPADRDRLVVLWLFKNSNAKLCEYFYRDDISKAFSMVIQIPKRSNGVRDEVDAKKTALVFDNFQILDATEDL